MTETTSASIEEGAQAAPSACPAHRPAIDVLETDTVVTANTFYAGAHVQRLDGDDSLKRKEQAPIPVPANSLLWKYIADYRVLGGTGGRGANLQSLFPQVGQGVSEHSQLMNSNDFRDIQQRGINSAAGIVKVLYSSPEVAKKYGIQLRNYHKSIKGEMVGGCGYHALNAETWYFTHVTFFEVIYRASEVGLLDRPLTREERAQIFEESKLWYSLMGVDTRVQPETFEEFEKYWADVVETQLFRSKMSDYNFAMVRGANFDKLVAPKYRAVFRRAAPMLRALARVVLVGPLEPALREKLAVEDLYDEKVERRYQKFVWVLRNYSRAARRLHLPLKTRYLPAAVEAFERAGVNPDDITLESARAALQAALAEEARARSLSTVEEGLAPETVPLDAICAKCERQITICEDCAGTGQVDDEVCDVCDGVGRGCQVHHNNWREIGTSFGTGLE